MVYTTYTATHTTTAKGQGMELRNLINLLEEMAEEHGDETNVVIVHQESYPLRERVHGVAAPQTWEPRDLEDIIAANGGDLSVEQAEEVWYEDEGPREVALVAGGHPHEGSPYGNRDVWERAQR